MKNLIIGKGEVGNSLYQVLKDTHETYIKDIEPLELDGVEVLNICFPYNDNFIEQVKGYQEMYKPKLTIIHSTVKPGTSRILGAAHSPIHGKHPNLADSIRTFTKYVGAENKTDLDMAVLFMDMAGIKVKAVSSPEVSELSKVFCTTYYGWNIVFQKELKKICDQYGVDFDEVYGWNKYYNQGYQELNMDNVVRPVLKHQEGKIGGHCVVPNCRLVDCDVTKFILEKNEQY